MQYFGGKARIAKPLAEYINSQLQENQPFVDLFCGSCNVISKVNGDRQRVANDLHYELISMHKAIQGGVVLPNSISNEEYAEVKSYGEDWLKGFVGFGLSYAGKWWGGYARSDGDRNYCLNAKNSITAKHKNLWDVKFNQGNYDVCELPKGALVYCDIPYKDTTKYSTGSFCHTTFYKWAEEKQQDGYNILVSEYKHNLPEGWEIVWEHNSKKDIRNKQGEQEPTIEVLMKPKGKE